MTHLRRTILVVVAAGGGLVLLGGLLPLPWPGLPQPEHQRSVMAVGLALLFTGLALAMLLPRLRRLEQLVARDLDELENSRTALQAGNRELQAMAGRLFSLQEDERRAISRDLHDDIGQSVTAIKLAAYAAIDEGDTQRRTADLEQIVELVDGTVTRLRNLSMLLRPPQLDALGLEAALRWQAGQLFRASPVELLLEVGELRQRPDNEIEQACFRIAQESLTNALRHAGASQVRLQLADGNDGQLHLQVVDDGDGFDPAGPGGLGLIIMRERAQSAGGRLQIHTGPGEGTCIELTLPYHAALAGSAGAGP